MDYETFTETIKSCLQVQLGDSYRVEVANVPRNNRDDYMVLTAFQPLPEKSKISKSVDIESIYQEYLMGKILKECVNHLTEIFEEDVEEKCCDAVDKIYQWEFAKNRIYPMLVARTGNEKYLEKLVHRPFLNLEIIYYIVVEIAGEERNVKVTNALNRIWNRSEEELYSDAMANLEGAGYELVGIGRLIEEMTGLTLEEENKDFMYVLLNEKRYLGAAGILSRNVLQMCADKVQRNFYLLPSSTHEMMVVPDTGMVTVKELRKMVEEVNREHALLEERLSSEAVFYYDIEAREIQIAR